MATNASYIYIYSNDGSERLSSYSTSVTTHTVTESGIAENGSEKWAYAGTNTFLGFATSPNATEPTYAIGSSITVEISGGSTTLYIVEAASKQEETSGVTVEYNSAVVATIPSGNKATIPVADKKMKTDIVITVPKAEGGTDSPLPTEVSTEAEMTALLTSGEVGGVYKYTGTTGTYENGALYVLEEETAQPSFTIDGTTYYFEEGMTWAQWCESEYNTDGFYIDSTLVRAPSPNDFNIISGKSASSVIEANTAYVTEYYGI